MTRIITLTALAALGLPGDPFHEPFHEPTTAGATQRYHAPGTPQPERLTRQRAQQCARTEQVRLPRYGLPGWLRPGLPHMTL